MNHPGAAQSRAIVTDLLRHSWPALAGLVTASIAVAVGSPFGWLLPVLPLAYLAFGAARHELRPRSMLLLQLGGLAAYLVLAAVVLSVDEQLGRYLIAAGWLVHAGWDWAHHRMNRVVPRWYAEWCIVFDVIVAAGVLFLY